MSEETYVRKILTRLCSDQFRELDPDKIAIEITKGKDYFMAIQWFFLGLSGTLSVDKECFKMKEQAFTGVLAHELAHILQRRSLWSCLRFIFMSEAQHERITDREVINRGLGTHLYAFQKYHDQNYKRYNAEDGMTKREIIAALKERKEL